MIRPFVLAILTVATLTSNASVTKPVDERNASAEEQLHRSLDLLGSNRLDAAIAELDSLVARVPNFRLAHLIRGDLLSARAGRSRSLDSPPLDSDRLQGLQAELEARMQHRFDPPPAGKVPRYLLRLSDSQRHAIVVDARRFRVYLYENLNGTPRPVLSYYSSLGKHGIAKEREGDKKTPVGVYHITSRIPGAKLPDFYGWGAFPIDYPNEWDRRSGRSGNGIWIHGVPSDTYARAPLASDGCIALANPEIEELANAIRPGSTPIVISDQIEWYSPADLRSEAEGFDRQLESWRRDWESRQTEPYLRHYARSFRTDGMDLAAWSAFKRRVNAGKTWIRIKLSSVSVLRSPGTEALAVVTFDQEYRSNNRVQAGRKRQYWVIEDGRWKIASEEVLRSRAASLPDSYSARGR